MDHSRGINFLEARRDHIPHFLRSKDEHKVSMRIVWRAVVLEYVATALFVFYACGSVVGANQYGITTASANLLAAIVQGFAIAALVYAVSSSSGGHLNPAVTFSFMIARKVGLIRGFSYIIAQLLGGLTGAALLKAVLPSDLEGNLGTTQLGEGTTRFEGFLWEFIVTFGLLFTIFGTAINRDQSASGVQALAPIPIGYSITCGVAIAYTFTGGSLNPARTFGPAVISHTWANHYIYWAGPMTAAIVVGLLEGYIKLVSFGKLANTTPNNQQNAPLCDVVVQGYSVVLSPGAEPVTMIPMIMNSRVAPSAVPKMQAHQGTASRRQSFQQSP